jgi:hypothetical protein
MASTLKINTLTGVSTAGSIAVTGEGNSTTTNLQQGLCKGWCNFDGTGTAAFRDTFNFSSLSDQGTGQYDLNFTNNMANTTYNWNAFQRGNHPTQGISTPSTDTPTNQIHDHKIFVQAFDSLQDLNLAGGSLFGDLA